MNEVKIDEPIVRNDADLLAFQRTILAQERTLMAWVRTSLSMISFGFTIYKFFTDLQKSDILTQGKNYAAQNFGLALVILGTVFLTAASIQHQFILKDLNVYGIKKRISLPFLAATLISLLGLLMLIGIFFHLGPLE